MNHRAIADAFWRMACAALCAGIAVSLVVAAMVLMIAAVGR
jgi:hypothetical protein